MGKSLAIKVITILFYTLFAFSILLGILFAIDTTKGEMLIYWGYFLNIIAITGVAVFMIKDIFRSLKSIIMFVSIAAFGAILIGVSYGLASDASVLNAAEEIIADGGTSKWSGATLYLLYILLGISFVSLLFTEISKAFK